MAKDIELFRLNDHGNCVLSVIYEKDQMMIPYLSDYFFNKACADFINELQRLENTVHTITAFNSQLVICYTDFFIAFEQFIGTLNVTSYFAEVSKIPPTKNSYFSKDVNEKISDIFKNLNIPKDELRKTGFYNKFAEVASLRNYFGSSAKVLLPKNR